MFHPMNNGIKHYPSRLFLATAIVLSILFVDQDIKMKSQCSLLPEVVQTPAKLFVFVLPTERRLIETHAVCLSISTQLSTESI